MFQDNDVLSSLKEIILYIINILKLLFFFGDKKGEILYDLWCYEVECLIRDGVKILVVLQSIRRLF